MSDALLTAKQRLDRTGQRHIKMFSANRTGDISEHKAVVWLLEKGYEVFINSTCTGPIDLVAVDSETGERILIDVKTRTFNVKNKFSPPRKTDMQLKLGVRMLYYEKIEHKFYWEDDINDR